jgi:(2Fe-2S) ferredoxin
MNQAKPCRCWETAEKPSAELMQKIHTGPLAAAAKKGPAEFEKALAKFRREHVAKPVIYIGTGTCGLGAGAKKTLEAIRTFLKEEKADADVVEVGCIGMCSEEPLVDVQLPGRTRVCYRSVTADKVTELLKGALKGVPPAGLLMGQFRDPSAKPYDGVTFLDEHPFFSKQIRLVLANCGFLDPDHIEEYIARGGYSQLARVLKGMSPADVRDTVEKSGLRGRGGAGFPTGKKWQIAAASKGDQKYLICNADEGDPGAFMDRAVIEGDPYRLLEGMAIAAYAIGASKAYVYIRAEYPLAVKRLKRAFAVAEEYGVLGDKILGSDFSLHIALKMGAGAFV